MEVTLPNSLFFQEVEQQLAAGNAVHILVRGISMLPTLKNDCDSVSIAPIGNERIRINEVYLFKYEGRHLLHRLIQIENEQLIFQGDGVIETVEKVKKEALIGRMDYIIYSGGRTISCHSAYYRIRIYLWCTLSPLRRQLLALYRLNERSKRKIRKIIRIFVGK